MQIMFIAAITREKRTGALAIVATCVFPMWDWIRHCCCSLEPKWRWLNLSISVLAPARHTEKAWCFKQKLHIALICISVKFWQCPIKMHASVFPPCMILTCLHEISTSYRNTPQAIVTFHKLSQHSTSNRNIPQAIASLTEMRRCYSSGQNVTCLLYTSDAADE